MLSDGYFKFELRKEIEVAGCNGPVSSLDFYECGAGYDSYYMKLRKYVSAANMRAPKMMENLKEFLPKKETEDIASGEELKPLHMISDEEHERETKGVTEFLKLLMGSSDDLEKIIETVGHMVGNSGGDAICMADGVRLKEAAWNRLHIEDKIDAAVQYCAFFGIGLAKPSSKEQETVSDFPTGQKVL